MTVFPKTRRVTKLEFYFLIILRNCKPGVFNVLGVLSLDI